jgi:hypothetical protein
MGYAPTRDIDASNPLRLGLRVRLRAAREARMASAGARTRLAERLEQAIARADRPHARFSAAVPVSRAAVNHARSALLDLAERLRAPRPVDPAGVRMAHQLLVDGAGPLYVAAEPGELRAATLVALRALDAHGAGH